MESSAMGDNVLTTAAQEAIRIAEEFLPRASLKRQQALAMAIVNAINLCEAELGEDIVRRLKSTFELS
jgi:hypothetical protein